MDTPSIENLSIADLIALADHCKKAGQSAAAIVCYKKWIALHPQDPALYAAWFNYGTSLDQVQDHAGAIIALRETLRLKPDFHQARLNLGLVLEKIGQKGPAVSQWLDISTALAAVTGDTVTHRVMALENIGRVLEASDVDTAAEDALRQRLDLRLDDKVIQHWIGLRMRQCKWPALAASERFGRQDLLRDISPLSLANLADDPFFQLATAHRYSRMLVGPQPRLDGVTTPLEARERPPGKLRIGYVSSDFREHAVGFSMVETLELHDRDRFAVSAYYCGIERDDTTKARIRAAVDSWTDVTGMDDATMARRIRDDEVDILIDLNGHTKDARTAVFARRPAPVAVNWFGFPSTMGSAFHHYIIADPITVPPTAERFFSETVKRLPCYQPNDRKRVVSPHPPTRDDEGLPLGAFVFCCLNGLQKLTEATFTLWLTILSRVDGSVLWLLGGTAETRERLRLRAAEQGIAPSRLVFADKKSNPDHVARYVLADLFLDSRPYGAHTTAADALWMGVPVLTLPGRSFASRVCASLVTAAGLDDMVCATPDRYVAQAVAFGLDRDRLAVVRQRLVANRDRCLLFDTARLVAHLEDLYGEMWDDFRTGHLPVPDLTNLDAYHDAGLDLDVETSELLGDDAYEARYREVLALRANTAQLLPDRRLWPDATEHGFDTVVSTLVRRRA